MGLLDLSYLVLGLLLADDGLALIITETLHDSVMVFLLLLLLLLLLLQLELCEFQLLLGNGLVLDRLALDLLTLLLKFPDKVLQLLNSLLVLSELLFLPLVVLLHLDIVLAAES